MKISGKAIAAFTWCIIGMTAIPAMAQDPNFHIFLCFGQSNMCGAGTIEAQDKTVNARFQMMEPIGCTNLNRTFGKWYAATPPLWGCNGGLGPSDYFGRTMVEKLPTNIRVGVIVVAVPGCDIRLFDKTDFKGYDTYNYVPAKYSGSAYAWLLELARLAQKDGVIKGFLMHQGETMPDKTKWPSQVKRVYDSLIADLRLTPSQIPLLAGELLYKDQGGTCGDNNTTIAKLPSVIPNTYVVSAQGLAGKDQFHFTTESNRILGRRYGEKMLSVYDATAVQGMAGSSSIVKKQEIFTLADGVKIVVKGDFSYRIFAVSGTLVRAGCGNGEQTIGAGLSSGAYFFAINHRTGSISGKFIKH